MANTKSAKKAIRSSKRKMIQNLSFKDRVKNTVKAMNNLLATAGADPAILKENLSALQKVLDKAAKAGSIHKNKANRLKSRYAKKATAQPNRTSSKARAKK